MKGLVYKSTGSWYEVADETGTRYPARVRGRLRMEGFKETNPVAVGDYVAFTLENNEGIISDILPRENHMLRQSVKKTGHSHVLAANVTQALLMATLKQPRTSLGFIDRFLVSAEAYRIPQILVFNKRDILDDSEQAEAQALMALYESLGARTFLLSALADDLAPLLACLVNHTTLIAGHSGVGKSSLLNRLSPHIQQTVGDISSFSNKGTHTTTFAEMFDLDAHTKIIDTPGVKEWGLVNMTPEELSDYFPEMRNLRLDCKFGSRCLHKHEPGCAVLRAVDDERIAASRYHSYLSMVEGHDNRK